MGQIAVAHMMKGIFSQFMYRHILGNTNLWNFNYLLLEEENTRITSSFDEPQRTKKGETSGVQAP